MNVLERKDENCADVVYNIIENEMSINAENIQFYAAHRVGKPRTDDCSKSSQGRLLYASAVKKTETQSIAQEIESRIHQG